MASAVALGATRIGVAVGARAGAMAATRGATLVASRGLGGFASAGARAGATAGARAGATAGTRVGATTGARVGAQSGASAGTRAGASTTTSFARSSANPLSSTAGRSGAQTGGRAGANATTRTAQTQVNAAARSGQTVNPMLTAGKNVKPSLWSQFRGGMGQSVKGSGKATTYAGRAGQIVRSGGKNAVKGAKFVGTHIAPHALGILPLLLMDMGKGMPDLSKLLDPANWQQDLSWMAGLLDPSKWQQDMSWVENMMKNLGGDIGSAFTGLERFGEGAFKDIKTGVEDTVWGVEEAFKYAPYIGGLIAVIWVYSSLK